MDDGTSNLAEQATYVISLSWSFDYINPAISRHFRRGRHTNCLPLHVTLSLSSFCYQRQHHDAGATLSGALQQDPTNARRSLACLTSGQNRLCEFPLNTFCVLALRRWTERAGRLSARDLSSLRTIQSQDIGNETNSTPLFSGSIAKDLNSM